MYLVSAPIKREIVKTFQLKTTDLTWKKHVI